VNQQLNKDWFWPWVMGAGVVLVLGGVGLYFLQRRDAPVAVTTAPPPPAEEPLAVQPAPPATAPPRPASSLPLPRLDESDPEVLGGLTELLGQQPVMHFVVPERIIRNVVVTIDNAARERMAPNQRPIVSTEGKFQTMGSDDTLVLSPDNYARYTPFVKVVQQMDAKTLVAMYRGLQPLFQQAYEELGHPNGVFKTRLLEVVRHLLATPEPRGEIRLVQPSVVYKYADESLEKLSAGQKLLIRMGPANSALIKAKLREIEAELR
jgi:Protein of unknown function (DUF3014)